MDETELNDLVSIASGLPVKDTSLAILALAHVMTACIQQGKNVSIPGFGSFAVKKTASRPRGSSAADAADAADAAPERRSVEFVPSVHLENAVNATRPAEERQVKESTARSLVLKPFCCTGCPTIERNDKKADYSNVEEI